MSRSNWLHGGTLSVTMDAVTTVVDATATYRLVRLAQVDTFPPAQALRTYLANNAPDTVWELYDCPWCLSLWVGLLVALLRRWCPHLWAPIALALAYSAAAGTLRTREET